MWSLSLTKAHNEALEKVQKVSLTVLELYVDQLFALSVLELELLEVRRDKLCLSFAKKCIKSQTYSTLFPVASVVHDHQLWIVELFTLNHAKLQFQ